MIHVEGLYKIFGHKPATALALLRQGRSVQEVRAATGHTVALRDVHLTIREGELFVVMGLSGSGKSTLIRCLNRLVEPTAGHIRLRDLEVTALDRHGLRRLRRELMSMVFQHFALLPHRTVLENIAYGLELRGLTRLRREEVARRWLEVVGLGGWEHSYPHQLSGGMRQRVGIARALAPDPEILLMDEPFSALDPLIRHEMQQELRRLQTQYRKTIVFITHDLDEALRLGDRIAILREGEVVQVGTPEEIVFSPADTYVADFTRGVNRARVLTAGAVMHGAELLLPAALAVADALERLEEAGLRSAPVVEGDGVLLGVADREALLAALGTGVGPHQPLAELFPAGHQGVAPETPLAELLSLAARPPGLVPVVDEGGRLQGIITRARLLAALAEDGGEVAPAERETEEQPEAATGRPVAAGHQLLGRNSRGAAQVMA